MVTIVGGRPLQVSSGAMENAHCASITLPYDTISGGNCHCTDRCEQFTRKLDASVLTSASFAYAKALRTLALMLGLISLTVQGLAPFRIAAAMAAPASQAGGSSIIICTIDGMRTIQLDADGKPLPEKSAPDQQSPNCPTCTSFHSASAFAAPQPALLVAPASYTRLPRMFASASAPSQRSHTPYSNRAPPASASNAQA